MIIGQNIFYVDASKVKRPALVKTINSLDEKDAAHKLAGAVQPSISLVYVDSTGTVQTVNNVPSHGRAVPATTNFYTEA